MILITFFLVIVIHDFPLSWSIDLKDDKLVYVNIFNEGRSKLEYLGNTLNKNVAAVGNISQIVINVTDDYTSQLASLFKVMAKHEVNYELERQYFYLYIVESSNEIFSKACTLLFDAITNKANMSQPVKDNIMQFSNMRQVIIDEKKSSLMQICINLDICRPFPAFSNHLVSFLYEIRKLPNSRFSDILKILQDVMAVKLGFFRKIMNDGIMFQIIKILKKNTKRTHDAKEFLTIISDILTNRNKMFKRIGGTINTNTKVVRILIDLVDKGFEAIGEEAVSIEFDNIIKSLKSWSMGLNDIRTNLINSCGYIFDILGFYWDPDTKKEVKLLIEVLMTGKKSENTMLYDDLLYKGSRFRNNDLFFADSDFSPSALIPVKENISNFI